jgi:hypothetical protein
LLPVLSREFFRHPLQLASFQIPYTPCSFLSYLIIWFITTVTGAVSLRRVSVSLYCIFSHIQPDIYDSISKLFKYERDPNTELLTGRVFGLNELLYSFMKHGLLCQLQLYNLNVDRPGRRNVRSMKFTQNNHRFTRFSSFLAGNMLPQYFINST